MAEAEVTPETDTDDVPDETRVVRVVRPGDVMTSEGVLRPKSSAFTDSRVDGAMSVFLENDVLADGQAIEDLLGLSIFEDGSTLWWLPMSYYRENGQIVTRRKIDEFPGHANVRDAVGKRSAGKMTRMAKASTLI